METSFNEGVKLPRRVLESKEPVWVTNLREDDNFPKAKLGRDIGVCCRFDMPILAGNQVTGILEFFFESSNEMNQALFNVLLQISTQIRRVFERYEVEIDLLENEAKLATIFNTSPKATVISHKDDGRILFANPVVTKLTTYSETEIKGKIVKEVNLWSNPEEREKLISILEQEDKVDEFEIEVRTKENTSIPVSLSASQIEIEDRQYLVTMARDITRRKQDEIERQQLGRQLHHAQQMESTGQLTGGITHNFNNILSTVLVYSEMSLKKILEIRDEKPEAYLNKIINSCNRGRDLVRELLLFSRRKMETPKITLISNIVIEIVALLKVSLPSSIELSTDLEEDLLTILIDPIQLDQTIMNLCINARDAMQEVGSLRIGTRQLLITEEKGNVMPCSTPQRKEKWVEHCECFEAQLHLPAGEYVELSVTNTGKEIQEDILGQIFKPFFYY